MTASELARFIGRINDATSAAQLAAIRNELVTDHWLDAASTSRLFPLIDARVKTLNAARN